MQIIYSILHSKSAIGLLPADLRIKALGAYASSISTVWLVSAGVSILTIIAACFMQEKDVGKVTSKRGKVRIAARASAAEEAART